MNAMELAALVAIANQDASQGVTIDANDPRLEALNVKGPAGNRHARRREAARARKAKKNG